MKTKLPFSCFPQLQRSGSQFIWFSANFYWAEPSICA